MKSVLAAQQKARVPEPLCKDCEPITFSDSGITLAASRRSLADLDSGWERKDTLPNLPSLTSSYQGGCSFCGYLISVIRTKIPTFRADALARSKGQSAIVISLDLDLSGNRSDQIAVMSWGPVDYCDSQNGPYKLTFVFENENWDTPWYHPAMVYAESDQVAQHLGISLRLPAQNVLDPSCLDIIDGWICACEAGHTSCKPPTSTSPNFQQLPTRLIDIGDTLGSSPRLVDTKSLVDSTKYIALSYCWGPPSQSKPQLTTTSKTLQAHKTSIPIDTMPLTFQDLVILVRHFRIRYIWIDALCIVQDDYADWEREAALMFLVYRNAHLTVVVGGASCHSGFLQRSNFPLIASIPFISRKGDVEIAGSYALATFPNRPAWEADDPHHMAQASWSQRGWTFQEDIMSRRVLYFADNTSFYRCQTLRCLEQDTVTYDNVRHWDKILYSTIPSTKSKRLYYMWESLVVTYSERKLTKGEDKFPALSGLARMFTAALQDEYLAGLWRREFHRGILWLMYRNSAAPTSWRAPSWSWAAWDGTIEMLPRVGEPVTSQLTIDGVHLEPAGSDPLAKLRAGWVILTARIQPVTLKIAHRDIGTGTTWPADVLDHHGVVLASGSLDSITASGWPIDGSYKPAPVERITSFSNVSAILIALTSPVRAEGDGDENEIWPEPSCPAGILVTPEIESTISSIAVYRRIGIFTANYLDNRKMDGWDKIPPCKIRLI